MCPYINLIDKLDNYDVLVTQKCATSAFALKKKLNCNNQLHIFIKSRLDVLVAQKRFSQQLNRKRI